MTIKDLTFFERLSIQMDYAGPLIAIFGTSKVNGTPVIRPGHLKNC